MIAAFYRKLALDSFFSIQSQPEFVIWNLSKQTYSVVHGVQRYDMGKLDGVSRGLAASATGVAVDYGRR
jgi:hypothetical protein